VKGKPAARARKAPARYSGADHRRSILAAAVEAFGLFGFDGTSVRRIAELAGIEQGHLAYYYPSKLALWQEAVLAGAGDMRHGLATLLPGDKNGMDDKAIRRALTLYLEFCADNLAFSNMMFQEFSINSDRREWLIEVVARPIWQMLKPAFEKLAAEGRLSGAPPAIAYYNFMGAAFLGAMDPRLAEGIVEMDLGDPETRRIRHAAILRPIFDLADPALPLA